MIPRIRLYWTVLQIAMSERLIYRADFALGSFLRFMPIVTTILLWRAIYAGVPQAGQSVSESASPPVSIAGYRYGDMVAYYLLVMIARAFSSMPGLASRIAQDIRDGSIKKYLIQPVDLLGMLFWSRVAHKLVYYSVAMAPFALVFFLCRGFFPGWPDAATLAGGIVALVLGFAIGFLFEATIGLIGFWFLEVSSLLFVVMMLSYFLSGHMFPLDLFPAPLDTIMMFLPFQYLAYFPAVVFLGRLSHQELLEGLAVQGLWALVLLVLARWAFARGVRRYSAYGG